MICRENSLILPARETEKCAILSNGLQSMIVPIYYSYCLQKSRGIDPHTDVY